MGDPWLQTLALIAGAYLVPHLPWPSERVRIISTNCRLFACMKWVVLASTKRGQIAE